MQYLTNNDKSTESTNLQHTNKFNNVTIDNYPKFQSGKIVEQTDYGGDQIFL